ncbi:hypothetical protein M8J77_013109 [Diaphorina citri]|nr:hypothetical protein M8J77_013109 [Diaphorina citri]
MEEEIDLEEVQLKVLTAKKQQLFSSIQRIFDVSKNVGSESSRATFLKKVGTVEVLFKEFVTTLEKCCSLELRINPGAKVSFSEMATVEEMVGYIKYKDGELAKPPPPAPAPNINKFYIWSNKNKFMNERMVAGYTYGLTIYGGKVADRVENERVSNVVVKNLMADYTGEGRTLVVDNYYTNIDLAHFLLDSRLRQTVKYVPGYKECEN